MERGPHSRSPCQKVSGSEATPAKITKLKPSVMQNYCPKSFAGSQWVPLRTRLFSFSGGQGEIGEPPGKVLESD